MFYYNDPTNVLETRLEVFTAIEIEEADNRRFYLMCWLGFPFLTAASLWWSPPTGEGAIWKLMAYPAIEVALLTLWLNSWRRLYKIRDVIRLASRELNTREDRE